MDIPLTNVFTNQANLTVITGLFVSTVWAIRLFWRRISKDKTETVKDRAEIDIIGTLQNQISTLHEENQRLRNNESEISNRLGRLESKEKEVANLMIQIDKMQVKLDNKDNETRELIKIHAEENTAMKILLSIKDGEIRELNTRIAGLEDRLRQDERLIDMRVVKKIKPTGEHLL